jgi:hypothetical protein
VALFELYIEDFSQALQCKYNASYAYIFHSQFLFKGIRKGADDCSRSVHFKGASLYVDLIKKRNYCLIVLAIMTRWCFSDS